MEDCLCILPIKVEEIKLCSFWSISQQHTAHSYEHKKSARAESHSQDTIDSVKLFYIRNFSLFVSIHLYMYGWFQLHRTHEIY